MWRLWIILAEFQGADVTIYDTESIHAIVDLNLHQRMKSKE